jgi:hypothetical protein
MNLPPGLLSHGNRADHRLRHWNQSLRHSPNCNQRTSENRNVVAIHRAVFGLMRPFSPQEPPGEGWGEPLPFGFVGPLPRNCGTDKDRTAGNRTTVRLSNGYSLLNLCERATAWGLRPGSFFLVQQRAKPVAVAAVVAAAFGVFGWLHITVFDSFLRFFLCHFILLSCFGLLFLLCQ